MTIDLPQTHTVANLLYVRLSNFLSSYGVPVIVGVPHKDVVGTGKVHVSVLQQTTGWSKPKFSTASHPVGIVNIYADSDRDSNHNLIESNAANKAQSVFNLIDPILDYVPGYVRQYRSLSGAQEIAAATPWNEVYGCQRVGEPEVFNVDNDPLTEAVLLHVRYELVTVPHD